MSFDSDDRGPHANGETFESVEFLLFESLAHHLIEKGLLTKNDALSVIQTVAHVLQGRLATVGAPQAKHALGTLERTYESFQALPDRYGRPEIDTTKIVPLRPSRHGECPPFPSDESN